MMTFHRSAYAVLVLLAVSAAGCGGSRYAPVSGVVTLNGTPCRNCVVMFLPVATAENKTPGRGSTGSTDENGHFELKTVDGEKGAAVGKHQVRITTRYNAELKGYEVWDARLGKMVKSATDPIPSDWNHASTQHFDVPSGGTDQANFKILSTPGSRGDH